MGTGKTQLTKGLARAMGINDEIISPTFNLELDYELPGLPVKQFSHFDAWRLQSGQELEELGFTGIIKNQGVIAIEWADRVAEVIRKNEEEAIIVWIRIKDGAGENERIITWGVL